MSTSDAGMRDKRQEFRQTGDARLGRSLAKANVSRRFNGARPGKGPWLVLLIAIVTLAITLDGDTFTGIVIAAAPHGFREYRSRQDNSDSVDPSVAPRPIGDIRRDAKAFISRSKSNDSWDATGAIVDLCILHDEIVNDPRFSTHSSLVNLRAQIATRLKQIRKQIVLDLKRQERARHRETRQAIRTTDSTPFQTESEPLTSQPKPADNGDVQLFASSTETRPLPQDADDTLTDAILRSADAATSWTGGPIRIWGHVGGNFAPPWDHGPELVNLIESTINPKFWRRNGGNGVIEYYRPLRILVISASTQVHDDVTALLRILRDTSR